MFCNLNIYRKGRIRYNKAKAHKYGKSRKRRREDQNMKFKDMPYQRVDFEQVEKDMRALMEAFENASDGEEQFQVHQKYYELTDQVHT